MAGSAPWSKQAVVFHETALNHQRRSRLLPVKPGSFPHSSLKSPACQEGVKKGKERRYRRKADLPISEERAQLRRDVNAPALLGKGTSWEGDFARITEVRSLPLLPLSFRNLAEFPFNKRILHLGLEMTFFPEPRTQQTTCP